MKNHLRKEVKKNATSETRTNFQKSLRHLAFLIRKDQERQRKKQVNQHEKTYRKNFFKFAKKATKGTLDEEDITPEFTKAEADMFFSQRYSIPIDIDTDKLDWFTEVSPRTVAYDTSTITPVMVKKIFKSKSPSTAPGEDGLMNGVLAKMPSVHHFLATHYNKTQESSLAPSLWAECNIKLCHKAGSSADPGNFRPLALSTILSKPSDES